MRYSTANAGLASVKHVADCLTQTRQIGLIRSALAAAALSSSHNPAKQEGDGD